jgi:hypothetical protein
MTFLQYKHGTIRTFLKGHMHFLHFDRTCVQRHFGAVTTRIAAEYHQKSAKGHGLRTNSAPRGTQEYLNALFPAQWVWHGGPFFWPS